MTISQEEFDALQKSIKNKELEKTTEGIIMDDPEASGYADAFLSGLTNDETYKTRWLAEQRFPGLVEMGIDPMQFYFVDGDGDISYKDPNDGFKAKKEFKESIFGLDAADYLDKIGPTGQFLSEVVGGVTGMIAGYGAGNIPGAVAGGAGGTAAGGSAAYGARAGLSAAFEGPPLNTSTMIKDLSVSSAFGGLPIGIPSKGIPKAFKGIYEKFPGIEGREALQDVVLNGGKTVDEKLDYLAQNYPDIIITRAEADGLIGNQGFQLQKWLQGQPNSEKLLQHYMNRNERVRDIAENFFDEILTGKYVKGAEKDALFGKAFVDADIDVAKALQSYLKKEKEVLQQRVNPLYKEAYDLDVAVDVGDILGDVQKVLADPNVSGAKKSVYKKIEKALIDGNTGQARNTTELLHLGLKDDFNRVFASLSTGNNADAILKREVTQIRNKVPGRLREINPSYKQATDIYNEATGISQQLEKSIAGQFAKVVDLGGTKAAGLSKKLFSGNIKPPEVAELKNILQKTDEGAAAWQNLKGTWLSTQWDNVLTSQTNPLAEPNAYLRALGIKSPTKAFPTQMLRYSKSGRLLSSPEEVRLAKEALAQNQAVGTKAKMWEAILEPDELAAFMDLTDMLQAVGSIQTKAGSDTFSNFAIDEIVTSGSKAVIGSATPGRAVANKAGGIAETILNIPSLLFQGTDLTSKVAAQQKDAYIDLLISHIVDPKKRVVLQQSVQNIKPSVYLLTQTFAKGGIEGVSELFNTMKDRQEALKAEQADPSFGPLEQTTEPAPAPNLQSSLNNFSVPQIDQQIFDMPSADLTPPQMASSIILPDEKDREIAMRKMGGLGSLV